MQKIGYFTSLVVALTVASCASTIHKAARNGNTAAVQEFLKQGVDVNARDENGSTPLLEALSGKSPQTARVLIEAGADVNVVQYQWTPVIQATIGRDIETLKLLLAKGADPKAFNSSAVRFAVLGTEDNPPKPGIASLLVQAGADVNAAEPNTFPFLWSAIQFGNLEVVQELLDLGADTSFVFRGAPPFGGLDAFGWAKLWKNEAAAKAIFAAHQKKKNAPK